ncbi:MAG TPA: phosphate ABC transporter permease PstA [Acidimicrobiia bacterium]|nr:phosphate ABC transporter permease PstA [Acidimicrobiia bacterium]
MTDVRGYAEPTAPAAPTSSQSTNGQPRRPPPRHRTPRRPRDLTAADAATIAGCLVSAVCFAWLVFGVLTEGIGWLGFGLVVMVIFLVLLWLITADRLGSLAATDRVVTAIVIISAFVILVPLVWLVMFVVFRGLPALSAHFFVKDQRGVTPVLPASAGGGAHAIVGTLEQVGLALLWSLPLGLMAAVFLNESRSRWRRPVRVVVDAMSGLPSIVAGLFIYAVFVLPYARKIPLFSFNGFMASLALALIMLPTITRTVEVVLRLVPDGLREASLAMGSSRARTVWSVVLPTARTGMTTAVVLGIARAVGETAPLLFTAFGYDLMNANPFNGAQEALPLFVFRNIRKPDVSAVDRGFTGALVLMVIVLALFLFARFIGRDRSRRNSRRARRAAVRMYLQEADAT